MEILLGFAGPDLRIGSPAAHVFIQELWLLILVIGIRVQILLRLVSPDLRVGGIPAGIAFQQCRLLILVIGICL